MAKNQVKNLKSFYIKEKAFDFLKNKFEETI